MLTVPQADLLEFIQEFKYIRKKHAEMYIVAKYRSKQDHITHMLRQLAAMGKIMIESDFVMLPGRKRNDKIITALDMVMDLTKGNVEFICKGGKNFILLFSIPSSQCNHIFGVTIIERGKEYIQTSRLEAAEKELTVVFILRDMEQKKYIQLNGKYYFAIQDEHGKYKFFKP